MEKFKAGDIVYHKATSKKCVVLKIDNDILKVRDQDDKEHDYYSVELFTQDEWKAIHHVGAVYQKRGNIY